MWDAVDLPPARRKPLPRLGVRYPRGDPSVGYRDDGAVGGRLKSLYVLMRLPDDDKRSPAGPGLTAGSWAEVTCRVLAQPDHPNPGFPPHHSISLPPWPRCPQGPSPWCISLRHSWCGPWDGSHGLGRGLESLFPPGTLNRLCLGCEPRLLPITELCPRHSPRAGGKNPRRGQTPRDSVPAVPGRPRPRPRSLAPLITACAGPVRGRSLAPGPAQTPAEEISRENGAGSSPSHTGSAQWLPRSSTRMVPVPGLSREPGAGQMHTRPLAPTCARGAGCDGLWTQKKVAGAVGKQRCHLSSPRHIRITALH